LDAAGLPRPEAALDPISEADVAGKEDRDLKKKIEIIQDFAGRPPAGKPRRLTLRFLVSPVELIGNEAGQVTEETETLPVGLVFRSVGYHGVPVADLPFDQKAGIIPNQAGRVMNGEKPATGLYVSGWIKRGPSGVIGTNKPDAKETVACMHEDMIEGATLDPTEAGGGAIEEQLRTKGIRAVSYADWRTLDELELERGQSVGRPRIKFTDVEETLAQLDR
jgi:ferredoxin--NADP+ reductase